MTPEQRMGILRVLGQVHIADDTAEEDIKGKEQFKVCLSTQSVLWYIYTVHSIKVTKIFIPENFSTRVFG